MVEKSNEELNAIMIKFLPELDSEYAKYPMKYSRWLELGEKGPKNEPSWMKQENTGILKNYVFGRGPGGPAYYHLLTKTAYVNLVSRISNSVPVACCACSKESRKAVDDWDTVKRIICARQISPVPDDGIAARRQIEVAQGVANAWYQGTQNEQLAYNIVGNSAF